RAAGLPRETLHVAGRHSVPIPDRKELPMRRPPWWMIPLSIVAFAGCGGGEDMTAPLVGPAQWSRVSSGLPGSLVLSLAPVGNGGSMLAGTTRGVWRSTDGGLNWAEVSPQPITQNIPCLAVSGTTVVAGTYIAGVFRSPDGGLTWTPATTQPTNPEVRSVAARGTTFLAGSSSGVFRSTDGGLTW